MVNFMIKTAILVDGGFYRRRVTRYSQNESASDAADRLFRYCMKHLGRDGFLYRVLYYDCPPSEKKVFHPLLRRVVDLKKEPQYHWVSDFFAQLKRKRKFALRMGKLAEEQASYNLKSTVTKDLLSGKKTLETLSPDDFSISLKQKGVDMRIGIDIVSMALKKQVDRIILISGDSDFVPAAKFARREGIDFILDPLGADIKPELSEHIDGLTSFLSVLSKSNDSADVYSDDSECF